MITDKDENEIKVDKEGRLVIDESIPMETREELDLENVTIRELELFRIGFEHGKRVAKKEFYNP